MKIILQTKEETLAWLAAHDEAFQDKYHVVSVWLCHELNRFEAEGYVYNSQAVARICRENGLTKEQGERRCIPEMSIRTEDGLLGALVYNAQQERRKMALRDSGFVPASQEVLAPLNGRKVPMISNGSLTGEVMASVKVLQGRYRLAPLRSRVRYYAEHQDLWIKPLVV